MEHSRELPGNLESMFQEIFSDNPDNLEKFNKAIDNTVKVIHEDLTTDEVLILIDHIQARLQGLRASVNSNFNPSRGDCCNLLLSFKVDI